MGKLAEIKDMEEAVENGSQEAKEFIAFTKRQAEHNALVEKLLKIVALIQFRLERLQQTRLGM